VLQSEAALIARRWPLPDEKGRLGAPPCCCASTALQQVRESKYIMLHGPRFALPEIRRLLAGSDRPP